MRRFHDVSIAPEALALLCLSGCSGVETTEWHDLMDRNAAGGWKKAAFEGGGEPRVENGRLLLPAGDNLTGAVWAGELPSGDYEIALEAMRVEGSDIFCGLTFPVAGTHASLILGGWGGGICGISSIDGMDASENGTTTVRDFENGKWYPVRLSVSGGWIEAWVGEERIVHVEAQGRRLDTRYEMRLVKPLGLASWRTTATLRGVRWRRVERRG